MPGNYREHPALCNSDLSYLYNPVMFKFAIDRRLSKESSPSLNFGSYVHTLVLQPDKVQDTYFTIPEGITTPSSPQQNKFCELILSGKTAKEAYLECYVEKDESKVETKATALYESLRRYINEVLIPSKTKMPVSKQQEEIAIKIIANINSHPMAARLLLPENETEDESSSNETEFYFTYEQLKCKSLIDRYIINHKTKTIKEVDLKTTSDNCYSDILSHGANAYEHRWAGFMNSVLKYGYLRQRAFYKQALLSKYPDYQIESYIVAVMTEFPYSVAVYKVGVKTMEVAESKLILDITRAKSIIKSGFTTHPSETNYYRTI